MATTKKAPAKETATKTKKSSTTTPTTKPRVTKAKAVVLPFKGADSPMVVMPNGQSVKASELRILSGMLTLELKHGRNANTQSAESMVQTLLKTQKRGANLTEALGEFNLKNVLVVQGKVS